MTLDFICGERHFLDHAAPVYLALPPDIRGRFLVDLPLAERARAKGIEPEPRDFPALRATPQRAAAGGDGPVAFVTSIGDTKIGRRLGYRRFVFMEHGAGQSYGGESGVAGKNPSYAGGMDREDTALFLMPNAYSADRWQRAYPLASVAVVGCPKLDTLPRREPDGTVTVAVTWHWPAWVCSETQPAAEFMGALPAIAREFRVIGTAHPKGDWPTRMAQRYRKAGIEFVADFEDVCRRADLLIFDNTSAGFEFAATGRPVVVLNARQYRRNVSHGLRFWEAANVGVQVDADQRPEVTTRRLLDGVARALELRAEDVAAREAALDLVYAYRTGAAERAAGAIAEWAAERVTVAA